LFLTIFIVTYVSILSSDSSISFPKKISTVYRMLRYHLIFYQVHNFGVLLELPFIFGANKQYTSELVRFLSRMAASKPTFLLFSFIHFLPT